MTSLRNFRTFLLASLLLSTAALAADPVAELRLYALDCGRVEFKDKGFFSDTGEYDGQSGAIAVPCFLIRHPKGTLVWDTGLSDSLAQTKPGPDAAGNHMVVSATLVGQLKALGLAPADVTFLAFSHLHWDHTGNANLFGASTWLMNRAELAAATSDPPPFGIDVSSFSTYKTAKLQYLEGDYDVFGDGSVRILKAIGHTAGHQVLELKLAKAGTVILSGDLYHQRTSIPHHLVPPFNVNRADTLASMDRIDRIVANTHARFIVQHDVGDFESLPRFPAFLN